MFEKKTTVTLKVDGMMCKMCAARVQKALEAVDGVSKATVDLEGKCAMATVKEGVDRQSLVKAVTDAGYKAEI